MRGKRLSSIGLFLAAVAAFALGIGHSNVALADATAKADGAVSKAKAEFAKMTPEQQREFVAKLLRESPRARLAVQMAREGYTPAEVKERLALLTDDEVAKLAGDPEAMNAGAGVSTAIFILSVLVIGLLIVVYFAAVEPVPEPPPAR